MTQAVVADWDEPQIDAEAVLYEQVRMIYQVLAQSSISTLGLSILVAWLLRNAGLVIWCWLAMQMILKLGEQAEVRWTIHDANLRASPRAYVRRLMVTQSCHAAAWASLLWICGRYATPSQFALVIMALGGVLSGGITTYSPLPRVHLAYIVTFIVLDMVIFAALRMTGDHDHLFDFAPLLMTLYCIGTYMNTRIAGANYFRTIHLGFSNARLASDLKREVKAARDAETRAAQANATKSTFLASASHDLRQPIHTLGLALELLDRTKLDRNQRDALGNARLALDASAEMLDALLDFSRAEAGVIRPRPKPFPVAALLHQVEEELGILADQKQIAYRTFSGSAWAQSDPALVKIILQNLVGNAIRYTMDGGVLVACRRRKGACVIEVWDTGIGIPPDQHEAIFADFIQLANPERDRRKGLGLGLAIAKRLAALLDCEIALRSVPGRGSVFRLVLPEAASQERVDEPDHARSFAAATPVVEGERVLAERTAHILIVEDDIAIRKSLSLLLRDVGHSVDAVETIAEALDHAEARRPDLIIADMRLRGEEKGTDAVRFIRAGLGENLPALLITGDTHPDRVAEATREDLEVLHKPVRPKVLLAAVQSSLN